MRDREWWDENDDVSDRAKKQSTLPGDPAHAMSDSGLKRVGFPRLFVFHQLNGRNESPLPDIPYMG